MPNSPDLVNLAELRVVKLFYIDASHTIYYILNCGVTQLNLTKILHDVETAVALLMHAHKRQYCISFRNARAMSDGGQF